MLVPRLKERIRKCLSTHALVLADTWRYQKTGGSLGEKEYLELNVVAKVFMETWGGPFS